MGLLDIIKQTALEVFQSTNPVNILYGTVIESKPLKIEVNSNFILTEEFLLVSEHLTRHERKVSIQYDYPKTWTRNEIGDSQRVTSSKRNNIGSGEVPPYENFDINYAKIIFEDGLKIGDKVILHRVQGGQKYYVSDRYREGDKIWYYPQKT